MSAGNPQSLYFCPGESHPIGYSVHLARLASYYEKCFDCPLRHQAGHLPPERVGSSEGHPRQSLIGERGLRGIYLNQFNRFHAAALANGFVRLLSEGSWNSLTSAMSNSSRPNRRSLTMVIGYLEHPASPDLMVGVVNALRACGVKIVDAGLTTGPLFAYTLLQQSAEAGMLISGAGCDPAGIGIDFFLAGGIPLTGRDDLLRIEATRELPTFRLPEARGGYITRDDAVVYLDSLKPRFHALRPLRIVMGVHSEKLSRFARDLFAPLPCSLELVSLPKRKRNLSEENDVDVLKLGQRVRETSSHLGFLIDDDGMGSALLDEKGELVSVPLWQKLLLDDRDPAHISVLTDSATSLTELSLDVTSKQSMLGFGPDSRVWFGSPRQTCDAFLTLSLILESLSRSDRELSERLG